MLKENKDWLCLVTLIVAGISILLQVFVVFHYWGAPQYSDVPEYIRIAESCYRDGDWYPQVDHSYFYIWNFGFVNFLILQLRLFKTVCLNSVFNLFFSIIIYFEIYHIAKRLFDRQVARLAVILYSLIYSNVMIVGTGMTELPFLFCGLSAICLSLDGKWYGYLFSGLLLAVANTIRPTAILFLAMIVPLMILRKRKLPSYCWLFGAIIFFVVGTGLINRERTGYFVFQATTFGDNLIQTANDMANGMDVSDLRNDGNSVLSIEKSQDVSVKEKDSVLRSQAFEWIKENPKRAALLYVKKIPLLFAEDSWPFGVLNEKPTFGFQMATSTESMKSYVFREILERGIRSIGYYFVLALFCYSLVKNRKELLSEKGVVVLYVVVSTLLLCVCKVSSRFHYPIVFAISIWAAFGLDFLIRGKHN